MSQERSYTPPILEIVYFGEEDAMTVSGGGGIELPDHEWE